MAKKINVKALRKRLNLNQIEFADRLGVTQGTISRLESGVMVPSGPILRLLQHIAATTIGVHYEWLTK